MIGQLSQLSPRLAKTAEKELQNVEAQSPGVLEEHACSTHTPPEPSRYPCWGRLVNSRARIQTHVSLTPVLAALCLLEFKPEKLRRISTHNVYLKNSECLSSGAGVIPWGRLLVPDGPYSCFCWKLLSIPTPLARSLLWKPSVWDSRFILPFVQMRRCLKICSCVL